MNWPLNEQGKSSHILKAVTGKIISSVWIKVPITHLTWPDNITEMVPSCNNAIV